MGHVTETRARASEVLCLETTRLAKPNSKPSEPQVCPEQAAEQKRLVSTMPLFLTPLFLTNETTLNNAGLVGLEIKIRKSLNLLGV